MEELLSDAERRRIIQCLIDSMPREGRDRQLTAIVKKLSGTDTVVKVERAYPSVSRGIVVDKDE